MFQRIHKPEELKYNSEVIIPKINEEKVNHSSGKKKEVKLDGMEKAEIAHSRFFNRIDDHERPDFGEYFGLPILSRDPHTREWEYATNIGDGSSKLNMKF